GYSRSVFWLLLHRAIFKVQTQPEHRARITGIEYGFVMQTEAALHGRRGDIVDAGVAAHVLEDVHALPQRQNAHFFVEGNGAHERGKNEAHEEQEQPVHTTPQTLSDDIGAPFPLDDVITHGRLIFESPYSRGWRSAFPDSASSLPCASSIYPGQPQRTPLRQTGTITLLRAATRRSLVISSRTMKTPNSRPVVLCMSGHDPSGGAGLQADIEALLAQGCHAAPTVTALTVQDTVNVTDFRVLDRDWVLAQARAVIADTPVAAVKLGMLGSVEMVENVLEVMSQLPGVPLVCDPVLRAGGGGSLGKNDVGYAMR